MTVPASKEVIQHFNKNFSSWLKDLKALVAIPGVSFEGFNPEKLRQTALSIKEMLIKAGLKTARLLEIEGVPPYVYAEWMGAENAPTLLLYAHYDVQPPMREELWKTPPFEASESKGRLFGRGTADDKAGVLLHIASIASWLKVHGQLPVNIKILFEGEEEVGSPNLSRLLKKHKSLLKNDCMILADMNNFKKGTPTLTVSLRGLVAVEVETEAIHHPLHSGMWGGPLPDPIMALSKILAGLIDEKGVIQIPELYKMTRPLTPSEFKLLKKLPNDHKAFSRDAGLIKGASLQCKSSELIWKKLWREPSLVVNSIESGGKKLAGNVLMDKAWCRLGIRTVPGMEAKKVLALLIKKIKSLAPKSVRINITTSANTEAWATDLSHPFFKTAQAAMEKGYKKNLVYAGCGGSIPFAQLFCDAFPHSPALLVGIEDPQSRPHSENESLDLQDFKKAVYAQLLMMEAISKHTLTKNKKDIKNK